MRKRRQVYMVILTLKLIHGTQMPAPEIYKYLEHKKNIKEKLYGFHPSGLVFAGRGEISDFALS